MHFIDCRRLCHELFTSAIRGDRLSGTLHRNSHLASRLNSPTLPDVPDASPTPAVRLKFPTSNARLAGRAVTSREFFSAADSTVGNQL